MAVGRTIAKISLSVVAIIVLLVGVGLAYTYYFGPTEADTANNQSQTPLTAPVAPNVQPTKPAADTKVGASVSALTSPVAPGSNTSISIRTTPGSKCVISVTYNDVASTDSGLTPKVADEYGAISWTWTVGKDVPVGKWPVEVTCVYNTKSAVVKADLLVEATPQM